jgi:glutamyl-tRNA(Gln) amidotransferase subunit E
MDAMGALMGKSMQKLQGKADGKLVNKFLKDKIQNIIIGKNGKNKE